MHPLLRAGQVVKGRISTYRVLNSIQKHVFLARNDLGENVALKALQGSSSLDIEVDILKRFQDRTSAIRPLIDEIEDPKDPSIICLAYLDYDLRTVARHRLLTRPEIKHVARRVLEALKVLHQENFVHTVTTSYIKSHNVLVSQPSASNGFEGDVKLADFAMAFSTDSSYAKGGELIGAPVWRSPEVFLNIPWGPPTDIWSFGTMIISLVVGGNYDMFDPTNDGIPYDHPRYFLEIFFKQLEFFGPFKDSYRELLDRKRVNAVASSTQVLPEERPYRQADVWSMPHKTGRILPEDYAFFSRVMKMDPRERPTTEQLLKDEWFNV